jgi:hypothetical protein
MTNQLGPRPRSDGQSADRSSEEGRVIRGQDADARTLSPSRLSEVSRARAVRSAAVTVEDLRALPAFTDVETAARVLGIGRTRAYDLAKRGEFPCKVIRIGTSYRVATADLLRMAGLEPSGE